MMSLLCISVAEPELSPKSELSPSRRACSVESDILVRAGDDEGSFEGDGIGAVSFGENDQTCPLLAQSSQSCSVNLPP